MNNRQRPLHQIEIETRDRRHRAELAANQRLFGRAIHLHDTNRGAHAIAGCLGRSERRQRGGGRRAAALRVLMSMPVASFVRILGLRHCGVLSFVMHYS
jgi:hypothetical protein